MVNVSSQASFRFNASKVNSETLYDLLGDSQSWFIDGSSDLRVLLEAETGSRSRFEVHYELFAASGDTRAAENQLVGLFEDSPLQSFFGQGNLDDQTRLFDLTKTIHQGTRSLVKHRIDRLNWTWSPDWGSITLGREAVTWGNGMIFNPMDLFNPFSPSDKLCGSLKA